MAKGDYDGGDGEPDYTYIRTGLDCTTTITDMCLDESYRLWQAEQNHIKDCADMGVFENCIRDVVVDYDAEEVPADADNPFGGVILRDQTFRTYQNFGVGAPQGYATTGGRVKACTYVDSSREYKRCVYY